MKYDVIQLIEIILYPPNVTSSNTMGTNKPIDVSISLGDAIANGYEIYKAIPITTGEVACIKYILIREIVSESR